MESMLHAIHGHTKKETWRQLSDYISSHESTLGRDGVMATLLQQLPITKFAAAWCMLLSYAPAKTEAYLTQVEIFWSEMDVDKVVGSCPEELGRVSHKYTELCREQKIPWRGLAPLLAAVEKVRPTVNHLTPFHSDFICLCLLDKQYAIAKELLSTTIYSIVPAATGVTPRDFATYYYYGGMIWLGLQEYHKALSFFETAVCLPATCLSAMATEAYKKYVLVSLILKGRVQLPKHCPNAVVKSLGKHCQHYYRYVVLYGAKGTTRQSLTNFIKGDPNASPPVEGAEKVFRTDNNYSLAMKTISAFVEQSIAKLTIVYETLKLSAICEKVDIESEDEAEKIITRMISAGRIVAHINDLTGVVTFVDSLPSNFCNAINTELQSIRDVTARIQQMDDSLLTSNEYILKQMSRHPMLKDELAAISKAKSKTMFESVLGVLKG
eukprot:TRINITY_DN1824_c0_g1_i1.p1 TRINITY_DN1824_c0_g1~~TRINITY_DN1824_c0_g1_i1.p1  ORF type:complete len:438 (+),score=51.38 TRINITY_DN1824_c0_g1_i1:58-1371(+)